MAVAGNQLFNAITGGSPDESVSSRLGHARDHGSRFGKVACAMLERINTGKPQYADHCLEAMATHEKRLQYFLDELK
jgi:hypothetical protein